MNLRRILGGLLMWSLAAGITWAKDLPPLNAGYKSAHAQTSQNTLLMTTGRITRAWELTELGLATVSMKHESNGYEWADPLCRQACDWEIPGIDEAGRLVSLEAYPGNDSGFTSDCLKVVATFEYVRNNLSIQYVIWAYPDASGLRTQLRCKLLRDTITQAGTKTRGQPAQSNNEAKDRSPSEEGIVDSFPISMSDRTLHSIGYFAGTQNRNTHELEILKEQTQFDPPAQGQVDWASILAIRETGCGILLVKESHKCVNTPQMGANTGRFIWDSRGIRNTGTGWYPEDFAADRYRSCWATWMVLFQGRSRRNGSDAQNLRPPALSHRSRAGHLHSGQYLGFFQ